jgi:hypothetical protein
MGKCDRIRATGQDTVVERAQSGTMAVLNSFSAYRDSSAEREDRRTKGRSTQLRAMEARRIALAQLSRTYMQKKARAAAIKREIAARDVSEKGVDSSDKPCRKDEPTRVGNVVASDPSAAPDHQVSFGSSLLTRVSIFLTALSSRGANWGARAAMGKPRDPSNGTTTDHPETGQPT